MPHNRRLAVLISGSGSNLQALIDALNTDALPNASIVLVLSNRKAAYGLQRAAQASPPIPTAYLALKAYLQNNASHTRDDYDKEIASIVRDANPDVVVLAGWMHVFGEGFLDAMNNNGQKKIEVINLHPALPGMFDGANAIERAFEAYTKGEISHTGVMVHRVVKEVDRGEPLVVKEVQILPGDTRQTLEERIHSTEWKVIVEGTRKALDEVNPA